MKSAERGGHSAETRSKGNRPHFQRYEELRKDLRKMDAKEHQKNSSVLEVGLKQNEYFQVPWPHRDPLILKEFKAASLCRGLAFREPRLGYMLIRTLGLLPLIILVCVACSS